MYFFEKIVYMYVEYIELYTFFENCGLNIKMCIVLEKLCTLNIQSGVLWIFNIVYIEYALSCIFLKNYVSWIYKIVHILKLNIHNCIYSLKNCVCWIWKFVYVKYTKLGTFLSWIYIIVYTLWKIVYVEYIESCTFFEKLCTFFDGVSSVHSSKNCVHIELVWDSFILLKLKTFCWKYYR